VKSIHIGQFQLDLQEIKAELSVVKESTDTAITIAKGGIGGAERGLPNLRCDEQDLAVLDPQLGRWGGQSERNGRKLSASVKPIPNDDENFRVRMMVVSVDKQRPLSGTVTFHLHPTFNPADVRVGVRDGKAVIERIAWGAFTVGAEADDNRTCLELDLSTVPETPELFRNR
jgi:hypothetical protein